MKNAILILLAVAVGVAITSAGAATFASIIAWAKSQLSNPFAQGVAVGAAGVLVLQTLAKGRR